MDTFLWRSSTISSQMVSWTRRSCRTSLSSWIATTASPSKLVNCAVRLCNGIRGFSFLTTEYFSDGFGPFAKVFAAVEETHRVVFDTLHSIPTVGENEWGRDFNSSGVVFFVVLSHSKQERAVSHAVFRSRTCESVRNSATAVRWGQRCLAPWSYQRVWLRRFFLFIFHA